MRRLWQRFPALFFGPALVVAVMLNSGCGGGSDSTDGDEPRAWLVVRVDQGGGSLRLLRSDDGGATWETLLTSASGAGITFVDRDHGWMGGAQIFRTEDGGRFFAPQSFELPAGQSGGIADVAFTDLDHGVAVGSAGIDGQRFVGRELLVQTEDGGRTWREAIFDGTPGFGGPGGSGLFEACVTDVGIGLAIGGGGFNANNHASAFVSEPRAARWRSVTSELVDLGRGYLYGAFSGVACVGARDLWVVGSRARFHETDDDPEPLMILHSTDGGRTWENQSARTPLGEADAFLESIAFADARHAWAVGYEGTVDAHRPLVLSTADAGAHWDRPSLPDDAIEGALTGVAFATRTRGLIIGSVHLGVPLVFATIDGGRRWTPVHLPADVDAVYDVSYVR